MTEESRKEELRIMYKTVLEQIARQRIGDELSKEERESADFEYGFEFIVRDARRVLNHEDNIAIKIMSLSKGCKGCKFFDEKNLYCNWRQAKEMDK